MHARLVSTLMASLIAGSSPATAAARLTAQAINAASFAPLPGRPSTRLIPQVLKAEVLLDRARFSPGTIDGIDGENFRNALSAYQTQFGLKPTGHLDHFTWDKLNTDAAPVIVERQITPADVKGPFLERLPAKLEDQAQLKHLDYVGVEQQLAEQVHASVGLLKALNKGARWSRPGTTVLVPQVVVDRGKTPLKVTRITVDKPAHVVKAFTADGKLAAFYPASIGSEEKPAPSGQFVIRRVAHNPNYTYNPKYAFKGVTATKPFTIAPGPNNPVGSVWMDLSYEGYGIHGTPQPDFIGKTQSHGCVRLTNWDAEDLASMVTKGTAVMFEDQPTQPTLPASTTAPKV